MKLFFGSVVLITCVVLGAGMVATRLEDMHQVNSQCHMEFSNGMNCWQDGHMVTAWRQDSMNGPRLAEEHLVLCTEHERVILAEYARMNRGNKSIYILRR